MWSIFILKILVLPACNDIIQQQIDNICFIFIYFCFIFIYRLEVPIKLASFLCILRKDQGIFSWHCASCVKMKQSRRSTSVILTNDCMSFLILYTCSYFLLKKKRSYFQTWGRESQWTKFHGPFYNMIAFRW